MNAETAQSIFAAASTAKKRNSKEDQPINFKSTNESLIKRNLLYKQQLAQATKTIEKLRDENVGLRKRNQELMDSSDDRKIEMIVEQRVKSKLSHAAVLHKKLQKVLQQTGLELDGLFKNVEIEPSDLKSKRMPKLDTNLDRLDESPVRTSSLRDEEVEKENEVLPEVPSSSACSNLANGTPQKKFSGGRGRRSELFQDFNSSVDDSVREESAPSQSTAPTRRGPMVIAPTATPAPATVKRRAAPKSTTRRQTPSADRFKKPATPAPVARPADSEVTDTIQVRRQRSAKANIKSMKEPSLGTKLRRPGKHDEPMPYIDTFY